MSRRKNSDSVSLFPFLAVLLCTMGVLIVLLVVLAKQAKLQAASTTPTETISIEDFAAAQRQVEDLEKGREESLKRLNEGGLLLSNLEDHIQRMQKQLEEFRDTVAHLHEARALSDQELKKARAEVERLNRLIDENRKKLQAAREEAAKHAASYAIIPYQGPYQTFRRPIFIECLDDSVVIQPEGVTLELSDLEGPPDPGNPLASAIRAAREYVVNAPAAAGDRPQDPYPLLIIRPEGIETYYRSRRAIESWCADFGYEMVRSDMDLAFPPPDPQLAQLENAAVQNARARRRELARSAPGPFRVYADGGRGGGFGDSEGPLFGGGIGGGGNEDRPGVQRYGESSPGGGASPPVADGPQLNRATGPGGPSDDPRLNENQSQGGDLNHSDETTDPRPGDASAGPSQGLDPQNHPAGTTPPDSHSAADASREGGGKVGGPGDRISIGRRSEGDGRGNLGSPYNPRSSGAGKSLATERGQNWALRKDQGPAVPLSRPIRFECHADRLILLPESENQSPIEIPLAADTARSIDDVVTAIADRADSWGIAGAGLYWKPTLVLYVSPGGVPRAADLSTLLDGSGLQLEIHQP